MEASVHRPEGRAVKLTGKQRFQLVMMWIKRGREGDKEKFIKKICEAKGIEYAPPPKIER